MNKKVRALRCEFGTPEHGWLSVTVGTEDVTESFDVSDVPADTLSELIGALVNLATGSSEETVEWNLEPAAWRWSFTVDGNVLTFATEVDRKAGLNISADKAGVLGAFCKALSDLGANSVWSTQDDASGAWSWAFPCESVARLKKVSTL